MPPKRGRPSKSKAAANTNELKAIQKFHDWIQNFFQQNQYVPPAPSQEPAATHQPSQPPTRMRAPGLELTYWEMLRFMKDMDMEVFNGGTDPIQAHDWMNLLERNFKSNRCPQGYKKDLAVHYLRGDAQTWWEGVVRSKPDGYEISWETFRDEFNKKYISQEAKNILECSFFELCQGTKTVREYEREFSRLNRFVGIELGEQKLIQRFLRGLRPDIRTMCSVRDFGSMIELVEKAAMLEIGLEEEANYHKITKTKSTKEVESHKRTWDKIHGGERWRDSENDFQSGRVHHTRQNFPESIDRSYRYRKYGHEDYHAQ